MQLAPLFKYVGDATALRCLLPYNHVLLVMNKRATNLLELLQVSVFCYVKLCMGFLCVTNLDDSHQLMRLLRFLQNPVPNYLITRVFALSPFRLKVYLERERVVLIHNPDSQETLCLRFDGLNVFEDEELKVQPLCEQV